MAWSNGTSRSGLASSPSPASAARSEPSQAASRPHLELPVAVVRVWGEGAETGLLGSGEAVVQAAPGLLAVVPGPGRPAVFDRAFEAAGRWLRSSAGGKQPENRGALVALARARLAPEIEWLDDEVVASLLREPVKLPCGALYATSHAFHGAEAGYGGASAPPLVLPSGHQVPVLRIDERERRSPSWRNRELLGLATRWVPRRDLESKLGEALDTHPVVRLTGPLGCGKTRLATTVLGAIGAKVERWDAATARHGLADFVAALEPEASGPRCVVVDSLEAADADVWAEVEELVRWNDESAFRWLLVARAPLAWPAWIEVVPLVHLPASDAELVAAMADPLVAHLVLPDDVAEQLLEASAGVPFLLEEILVQLTRQRQIRQVFGNYFYKGGGESRMEVTSRMALHLESELERLGADAVARLSATTELPLPADDVRAAAGAFGWSHGTRDWEAPYLAAGLLELSPGPWGEGVVWRSSAQRRAVEATLVGEVRVAAARQLGERLALRAEGAERSWAAYRLLAGSPAGARALLAVVGDPAGRGPGRAELLEALLGELESARSARPRHPELELDLLWALLPLARRLGRLHELREVIDRAMLLAEDRPDRLLAFAAVQAELARKAGRLEDAEEILKRALRAARRSDERRQGPLLLELARIVAQRGRPEEAQALLDKTLAIAEQAGRRSLASSCRFQLGNLALAGYRLDEAQEAHEKVLEFRRRGSLPAAISQSLTALGTVALQQGNYPHALARYREACELAVAHALDHEEAFAQLGVGRALSRLGDHVGAAHSLRRALALRKGRDDALGEAIARLDVAENHLRLEQVELAQREARQAHFDLGLMGDEPVLADAEQLLGRISLKQQRPAAAAVHLAEAERLHRASGRDQAVLADLSLALRAALAGGEIGLVVHAFDALADERARWPQIPSSEMYELDLYRGALWLTANYVREIDALPYLRHAYEELMRRTAFLEPALRQRFLYQIPEHQETVDAAGAAGLGLPNI